MQNGGNAQQWKCTVVMGSPATRWWAHVEQSKAMTKGKWANSISIFPCCDSLDWILAGKRLIIISIFFNSGVHVACRASWLPCHEKAVCHQQERRGIQENCCALQESTCPYRWSGISVQHLYISATYLRWFHKQEPKQSGNSPAKFSLCVLYTFFFKSVLSLKHFAWRAVSY